MNENIRTLLIDAYIGYICGGYDIFDVVIDCGEKIYCELNNKDIDVFRLDREEIYNIVWDQPPCAYNGDEWKKKRDLYVKLLNNFFDSQELGGK